MKFLTCTAIENRIEGPIPSQINMQIHTEHQIMLVPNTWYILLIIQQKITKHTEN